MKPEHDLSEKPYYIIDILPEQVPQDSPGRYFAVERYLLKQPQITAIRRKFADIILKLYCYYDFSVCCGYEEDPEKDPEPGRLCSKIVYLPDNSCIRILIGSEDAEFILNGDDTYMTLYDPSAGLLEKVRILAEAEGLFVRKPEQQE